MYSANSVFVVYLLLRVHFTIIYINKEESRYNELE